MALLPGPSTSTGRGSSSTALRAKQVLAVPARSVPALLGWRRRSLRQEGACDTLRLRQKAGLLTC
jgi:hypothetical protein